MIAAVFVSGLWSFGVGVAALFVWYVLDEGLGAVPSPPKAVAAGLVAAIVLGGLTMWLCLLAWATLRLLAGAP